MITPSPPPSSRAAANHNETNVKITIGIQILKNDTTLLFFLIFVHCHQRLGQAAWRLWRIFCSEFAFQLLIGSDATISESASHAACLVLHAFFICFLS